MDMEENASDSVTQKPTKIAIYPRQTAFREFECVMFAKHNRPPVNP
jgi:hypothetical protein